MSDSIVRQLILKDLHIMKVPILCYWAGGLTAILIAMGKSEQLGIMGLILFVAALAAAGIHPAIQTIVTEKDEQNLPFIMSLPVTMREYTFSKIIVNVAIFTSVWVTLSGASFIIFTGDDGLPNGTIPFVSIILVSIYVAFAMILAVALTTQSMGLTVTATVVGNLGTQMFLWFIGDLHEIRSVIGGRVAVWNGTTIGILIAEVVLIILMLVGAVLIQYRKKDLV